MSAVTTILFAALAGLIPSITMIISSALLLRFSMNARLEAAFQNLAAGMILGAVAAELFPLLGSISGSNGAIGECLGFVFALVVVYGNEPIVEAIVTADEDRSNHSNQTRVGPSAWNYLPLDLASEALANNSHRMHIMSHLREMNDNIDLISIKADEILSSTSYRDENKAAEDIDEQVYKYIYHCLSSIPSSCFCQP